MAHLRPATVRPCVSRSNAPRIRRQGGLTLVELMVALVLGLVVTAGVLGIYLSSRQAFRTTENLARMQENGRFAFELLMRDIREAGHIPCGSRLTANALQSTVATTATPWWADTDAGMLRGIDATTAYTPIPTGGGRNERVDKTAALVVLRPTSDESVIRTVISHDAGALKLRVGSVGKLAADNFVVLCDGKSSALLQIAAVDAGANDLSYNGNAPNCSALLGSLGPLCASPQSKTFDAGAVIAKWEPGIWFVGNNDRDSRSLYRASLVGTVSTRLEMIPGVHDLQIEYLRFTRSTAQLATSWVAASSVANWNDPDTVVVAARVTLTLRSEEKAATSGAPLERRWIAVAALRNRDF